MKSRMLGFSVLSLVGFVVGLLFRNSTELGLCLASEPSCINNFTWVGDGFFYGAGALTIVFFMLLFVPRAVDVWKKFALWFVPLAGILFVFYPEPGSGDYFSPYPETVFQYISAFYILVSLVIIGISEFKRRK